MARTLIADDHALIRAGLRDALNNLRDIEIVGEVGNGRDLLGMLEREHPDLLLMDVNMPDFEPVLMVQKFREMYPEMKILVVSAYDDEAYVVGLLAAGVNGYHLKDQPLTDLHSAVRRILQGGRWISDPLVGRLVDHHADETREQIHLTKRHRQLLYLLTQGYSNQRIAMLMDLSIKTVENHLTSLYKVIGVESRLEANKYASHHPELLAGYEKDKDQSVSLNHASKSLGVLLVDDNIRYRAQLGKLLSRTYPNVVLFEAEDPADAVNIAAKSKPQLAFIDVVLRDEDGIRVTRRIKNASPQTRIILMSAYPDREFRRLGMSAGAVAFLDKKDIDTATVQQVVGDAMHK